MDSSQDKGKEDSKNNLELYNESLDWIRSMNLQMKNPGNFISSRLESVSLEQVHRELSSLLLKTQSHGSSLLRSAFTNATSYNDNLKRIIMSLWPIKDKVSENYNFLKTARDDSLHITQSANTLLNRLQIVLYSKLAISTVVQAQNNFNNLCDEVVNTFSLLHTEDVSSKYYSKLSHVIALIDSISKKVYKMNTLIQNLGQDYNVESNWLLLEFAPKELNKVSNLLEKFKFCDQKLGELLLSLDTQKKQNFYDTYSGLPLDSNLHMSVSLECGLDSVRSHRLSSEFSPTRFQNDIKAFSNSLALLIEVCANIAFTRLYKLYTDLKLLHSKELTNEDAVEVYKTQEEIKRYLSALVSIVRGHTQLAPSESTLLLTIFNDSFLVPFLVSNDLLSNSSDDSTTLVSFQEESNNFPKFVDMVQEKILDPNNSILAKFLNDLSLALGQETFKSQCVLDPLAKAIFKFVEDSYSSIFTPLYPQYYSQNFRAFDRLLSLLETSADSSLNHLLKWRGSPLPNSFATRFCTGVICENYVEKVSLVFYNELEKYHELDGTFHRVHDRRFYVSSSEVLYRQVLELFSDKNFFYHLFPQYLQGARDLFNAYMHHLESFITHMESTDGKTPDSNITGHWPTGLSFAFSAYVLHDVNELLDSLKTSDLESCTAQNSEFVVNLGDDFGSLSKLLLHMVQKPLCAFVNAKNLTKEGLDLQSLWRYSLQMGEPKDGEQGEGFLQDVNSLFLFTFKGMRLLCKFLYNLQDHMNFVKDKLEQYIVSSLYNSSKCSLQFIQSLSTKYRTSNKQASYQVSDYVKFLLAPMSSFHEFSLDIISKDALKNIMLKIVHLVSSEYSNHISNLLKSVENLNSSLMKTKNPSLNEYSDGFLIVDMEMLRTQISTDVGEFYDNCVNTFNVDRTECSSLDLLLQYRT